MKLETKNKGPFIKALKALIKDYSEDYTGTITVDITKVHQKKSKLQDYKNYRKEAYRGEEGNYATDWLRQKAPDNPLAKEVFNFDYVERNRSVDMIETLEDVLCNYECYLSSYNIECSDVEVKNILTTPGNYSEAFVKDLEEILAIFYKLGNPLFRFDW